MTHDSLDDPGTGPLDGPILDGLRLYGGPQILLSTIDSFLDHVPLRLQELADAIRRGDLEEMAWAAHGLRGSCGTVGAMGLVRACARLEAEASAGRADEAAEVFAELERQWPAVLAALEAERARAQGVS
jgi:HPt (histidine-containing phosphotransfer) domain-containing protein